MYQQGEMTFLEKIFKTIKEKSQAKKKIIAKNPDEDFIPYVCHYDGSSILTKNGELLQIIRVTGLTENNVALDLISLRETIRDAIYENVKDENFAFWFHTIRRRKSVITSAKDKYKNYFAKKINEKWVEENQLESQFINELYITIIHEGLTNQISDFKSFAKSFSYKTIQEEHKNHLQESSKKLNELVQKIFIEVEPYGAKILGIKDYQGILYSEPMRFFGKIINLCEERYALSINDIASDLASHKTAFGNREIEVLGSENKNFAAILSIKEYHEVLVDSLDKILNLPFEFIISQSFDYCYDEKELEPYYLNDHMLEISQDEDFRELAGFKNFIESNKRKHIDYGKIQTSLMVVNNNREKLEKDVAFAVEKFSELGFILVREDIFNEHCFWAQLPANFAFLRRKKIINTLRIAGFAALNSFPSGSFYQNHWGDAITTLKTIIGTPYFFNFHEQDLGHTLIFGPKNSGKTILTNFLVAQSLKISKKIYYFDFKKSSKCFIKGLQGNYYKITKNIDDEEFLQMNPFSLPNNEENAAFLTYWIKQLLMFLKAEIKDDELEAAFEIIKNVLNSKDPNFLVAFDALRTEKTKHIYEKLKIWGNGKLSYIFGSQNEIDWSNPIIGFDFDEIINQKPLLIPVISYLLHKIETMFDGSPTIIVIDEFYEFFDNQTFKDYLEDMLNHFRKNNCMIIFNSQDHLYISESQDIAKIIQKNLATQIYLPNIQPQDYCQSIFELNDEEFDVLRHMTQDLRKRALIKHSNDSLIVDIDLNFLEEYLDILSSDEISVATMEEIINAYKLENPDKSIDSEIIIEQFKEIIKAIKEEQKQILMQKINNIEFSKEELKKQNQDSENDKNQTENESENEDEDADNFEFDENYDEENEEQKI